MYPTLIDSFFMIMCTLELNILHKLCRITCPRLKVALFFLGIYDQMITTACKFHLHVTKNQQIKFGWNLIYLSSAIHGLKIHPYLILFGNFPQNYVIKKPCLLSDLYTFSRLNLCENL